jgi:hypothetical protein
MAKLFIQDTTLTAIADAIRSKTSGGSGAPIVVISKTPNVNTPEDYTAGYGLAGYQDNNINDVITIPGAVSMKVDLTYQTDTYAAQVQIFKGAVEASTGQGVGDYIYKGHTAIKTASLTIEDTDTITINFIQPSPWNTTTGDTSYFGYYAEVTGYDADGNQITDGGANTTQYKPTEMPAAILAISGGGSSGGITPSGELAIYDNGSYDVTEYASAVVSVAKGVFPEGDFPITENGQYNITRYNTVTVEVPTGGGTGDDLEYPVLSGPQQYTCQGNSAGEWAIKNFGSKITTSNLLDTSNMFANSGLTTIPVIFNYNTSSNVNINYMFQYAQSLTTLPEFSYIQPNNMVQLCYGCSKLINVNSLVDFDMTYMNTSSSGGAQSLFYTCRALRNIPAEFLKKFWALTTNSSRSHHNGAFTSCSSLDEVSNWGITTASLTSNTFQNTVSYCSCLKKFTFDTNDDGTAKTAKWKNQVIDLSAGIGYDSYKQLTSKYFSGGRDSSTEITDAASYETLKNNPNSWTKLREYSRYNKASAVETINSLPDCSAYIAGSTANNNTIKFEGAAGSATDAGAINTMTEAEIAVAAAKGWTVTFV